MDITGIIIAGNEEKIISKAVESLSFCKNLVLVAANSTDKTTNLVKKLRPDTKIIKTTDAYGRYFFKWRNLGLKAATNTNIIYLDADEVIPRNLITEIDSFCKQETFSHAAIPRLNTFLGKKVTHGGTYPDYQKRLFKKNQLSAWKGQLHEYPIVRGKLIHFINYFLHDTHRDLSSMTQKTLIWTSSVSQSLFKAKHPPIASWRLFRVFLSKFLQRYVKESMWKDGIIGYISSVFESFDSVITYSKLWELQKYEKGNSL